MARSTDDDDREPDRGYEVLPEEEESPARRRRWPGGAIDSRERDRAPRRRIQRRTQPQAVAALGVACAVAAASLGVMALLALLSLVVVLAIAEVSSIRAAFFCLLGASLFASLSAFYARPAVYIWQGHWREVDFQRLTIGSLVIGALMAAVFLSVIRDVIGGREVSLRMVVGSIVLALTLGASLAAAGLSGLCLMQPDRPRRNRR
jgi:hypothetical protein